MYISYINPQCSFAIKCIFSFILKSVKIRMFETGILHNKSNRLRVDFRVYEG